MKTLPPIQCRTVFVTLTKSGYRPGINHTLAFAILTRALLAFSLTESAAATTLVVYNNNDVGAGSLRQAISDNTALGGSNTISFSNIVTGTITLSTNLVINAAVTIQGPGANLLTISGNGSDRIFMINAGPVSISGLRIANGHTGGAGGGGIYSAAVFSQLNIRDCVFENNSSAGGNGGAIRYVDNAGSILNTTFHGNTAAQGGAIMNANGLSITNCTFTGNSANDPAFGWGGAIFDNAQGNNGNTEINSCTIVGNTATKLGGGIVRSSNAVYVRNSIIAQNTASANPDTYGGGGFVSQGYNLIGNTGTNLDWTAVGDQVGTSASPINPRVGSLQDNGGPVPTIALLPGSPALDQGRAGTSTDARGRPRPFTNAIPPAVQGDHADIGAYELSPLSLIVSNNNDKDAGSLRQVAQAGDPGDIIKFASNVVGGILLTSGPVGIQRSLTVAGPGAGVLTVSGNHLSDVFEILDGAVAISGLTIADGRVLGTAGNVEQDGGMARGGAIFNQSVLALNDCVLTNCLAQGGQGGGTISGFAGNGGNAFGGAIANIGTLSITNCSIAGNSAVGGTGGVATGGGSDGSGGQADGGAIYSAGPLTIVRSGLAYNNAAGGPGDGGVGSGSGGALYNDDAAVLLVSTLASNSATGSPFDFGGGVYHNGTSLTLRGATVAGNQADYGGGLYISAGVADLGNCLLAANFALGGGPDCSGSINSSDFNLIQNTNNTTFSGATAHNITSVDPLLTSLGNYGGLGVSFALQPSSPAIDKGKSFGITTDQRGAPRVFDFPSIANAPTGDGADIGAFELSPPSLRISRSGNNAIISWPAYASGFRLQSDTNVASLAGWTVVPGSAFSDGSQFYITNAVASGQKFFRLIFP
jgi:predicted outer membrane repeat protein